jgi:hypothetical protein
MPLQGQWDRQHTPLRGLGRRERRILVVVLGVLVVAAGATAFAALRTGTRTPAAGCVTVTFASTTGAARIHACGAAARRYCHQAAIRRDPAAGAGRVACRRAHLIPRRDARSPRG